MKSRSRFGLWWVPLVIGFAPVLGWTPAHRDLVDFFAPMRAATAAMLSSGVAPWLNLANGCGEAWFANPETAVLYPPAWIHLFVPTAWGMALEVGFHLAVFSFGVGLLARELGADRYGRVLAEVSAWSIGPVVMTVGVLNNLETLTWLPWMVWAARRRDRWAAPALAAATTLAWFGGEPQIWAVGLLLALCFAVSRRTAIIGLGLGVCLAAVQVVPFLFWVIEGDRGPQAADLALRGALGPVDWLGLVAPGWPGRNGGMVYVESLFVGAPLLCCAVLGGWRRKPLLVVAGLLALVATLPGIGADGLYLTLTRGLVRYPSRFALLGVVMLLPVIGTGAADWLRGRGNVAGLVLAGAALIACAVGNDSRGWIVAGIPAALMIASVAAPSRRRLRSAVLAAGVAAAVVVGWPLFGFKSTAVVSVGEPVWPEAADGGRVYSPTPSVDDMQWLSSGFEPRRLWPIGYLNLDQGLTLARTDSPVAHHRLARHLEITDEGPARRWWLDSLSARWVVLPEGDGLPSGMEEVRRRGGMRLLRNLEARSEVSLDSRPPSPDQPPVPAGRTDILVLDGNRCTADVVAEDQGWIWVSLAPLRGWRWSLDGREVVLEHGPGIVQFTPVAAGPHRLQGSYRPPGLRVSAGVTGAAALGWLILVWVGLRNRHAASPERGLA